MTRPALPLIYKANGCVAAVLGLVFILLSFQLKNLYAGKDAARDLIVVSGWALLSLGAVTITVANKAGPHFMALARGPFGAAYIMIAPITSLVLAPSKTTWIVRGADL